MLNQVSWIKRPQGQDAQADRSLTEKVSAIIERVKTEGDTALRAFSQQFDNVVPTHFEVSEQEIAEALQGMDAQTRRDSEFAINQVRRFAQAQLATMQPLEVETLPGVHLGHRIIPVQTVGCYVPGGRYPILSAPVMSIVPATVAGCEQIIACLPPGAHPAMIAVCHLAGAHRIFRVGGAQAIAAMAWGTESIPSVDKIVGPGNAFVNEAKRQVFGRVGIDALAGPSEIFTIADDSADPRILAADMLAQAEHDIHTRVGLATTSRDIAERTLAEVERQLASLPTAATAGEAWRRQGEIALCEDEAQLIAFADHMATEHLQVHTRDPHATAAKIRNYGSLFIGQNASVVFSDKCCGTNHTLPTMAAARYTGGLWVGAYVKICTHQWIDEQGIPAIAEPAIRQSRTEGMQGHRRAAEIRLRPQDIDAITTGMRD
ncbi:histidinol dehydrogenase [Enterobacter cloacae complex sp. I1M]|uniref:histidinol dehydrogenase n=1 Tax=unclassified Enterobacter cloacae complex TaxID=2757714 RepID=UPI00187598F8|nr:histidinol dehydrogenase [Enterobacter cloacae complex sp. I1M]MCU2460654.1 histidinol dehydrogenase [Enterobacter hormaechei subsp. hoffmannii]HCT9386145.1 histidinol dehydrogenase [Enterobacter hormaechei]MBE4925182.1 histidinol dehydrogenase [Enterobacter cloacae complex sp. I1M]MCU3424656.1 histidinol dehydrogenase [Enterobacter hormaechei subsp. hoffmannii]MCU3777653.1 histidinol dehydrogenase [Enterobacter hormaechei subsp. hoffmannii]